MKMIVMILIVQRSSIQDLAQQKKHILIKDFIISSCNLSEMLNKIMKIRNGVEDKGGSSLPILLVIEVPRVLSVVVPVSAAEEAVLVEVEHHEDFKRRVKR